MPISTPVQQPAQQPQIQPNVQNPAPVGFNNQPFQGFNQQDQAPQVQPDLDPNNEIVSGHQHKAEIVAELEAMGFEKALVEQALVAAFYNRERAIDYLLNVG